MDDLKKEVHNFWNEASCGEQLYLDGPDESGYLAQMRKRYELEPFIASFARFEETGEMDVLEIGVGLGADQQRFAQAGARLTGIDLTGRAVDHTRKRLGIFGLLLTTAKRIWPRRLLRAVLPGHGLFMLIEAIK